jgi:hypothetical protein
MKMRERCIEKLGRKLTNASWNDDEEDGMRRRYCILRPSPRGNNPYKYISPNSKSLGSVATDQSERQPRFQGQPYLLAQLGKALMLLKPQIAMLR